MKPRSLRNDSGSVMVEFAAVAMLFFVTISGVVEIGYFMWQYGAVSKGAQSALRHAAVSDPVTRSSASLAPNSGIAITCRMDGSGNATTCSAGAANHVAMRCILLHMQSFASFVSPENIEVIYRANGLGFGGVIAPTIEITLRDLNFPTLFLGYLAGRMLPALNFTITAEDMNSLPLPSDPDTNTTTCGIAT